VPVAAPRPTVAQQGAPNDRALFQAVANRIASGDRYYAAMGHELRARNYPAASTFNWRPPLTLVLVAHAGPTLCRVILTSLSALLFLLVVGQGLRTAGLLSGVVAMIGAVGAIAVPQAVYFSEIWAGACIGVSLLAYQRGYTVVGAALAIVALAFRELALPYVLFSLGLAIRERNLRELRAWAAGLVVCAAYYGLHVVLVSQAQTSQDASHTQPWIAFGGLSFLLSTVRVNGWLFVLPLLTRVFLAVSVLGLARMPPRLAITLAVYAVLFLVVGQPFNTYWGFLAAPLWAVAAGYGVQRIADLSLALRQSAWPIGTK
jgi:hypothetical protein